MVIPFGVGIGDFLAVSKLIGHIVVELSKHGRSSSEYQELLLELDLLDRALKQVQSLVPAAHDDVRRLASIRALATTCKLPLAAFLNKIEKFDNKLGTWTAGKNRFAGFPRRMQWSLMFQQDVKDLRAKLAAHVQTITLLLMTQTSDALAKADQDRHDIASSIGKQLEPQGVLLDSIKLSTEAHLDGQTRIEVGQHQLLSDIKSQADVITTLEKQSAQQRLAVEQQTRDHGERLDRLQDVALSTESVVSQSLAATLSLQDQTTEIASDSRSVLVVALEILNRVSLGISKAQDIARQMSRLVHNLNAFTTEMRQRMAELLQMFGDLQTQLQRLGRFLPKALDLPMVRFRDAFNEPRLLPFDLCREWKTFKGLVTVIFTDRQGLRRVQRGQFIVNHARFGRQLNPAFWRNAIEPGDELSMAMLLPNRYGKEGMCPWEDCGASTEAAELIFGGKICATCYRWAAVLPNKTGGDSTKGECLQGGNDNQAAVPMAPSQVDPKWKTELEDFSKDHGNWAEDQLDPRTPELSLEPEEEEDITLYHFVKFALLGDVEPLASDFTDRGSSLTQTSLDIEVKQQTKADLQGVVQMIQEKKDTGTSLERKSDTFHGEEAPWAGFAATKRVKKKIRSDPKEKENTTERSRSSKEIDYMNYSDVVTYGEAKGNPRRTKQPRMASAPQRAQAQNSAKSSTSTRKATEADAAIAGIPAGYSVRNWDPAEHPIMLLGSVFDANSLGKWIYDWTVYHHGPATPMSEVAGDLWLLLIKLAGKLKRAEECLPGIKMHASRDMIEDFLESGARIWNRFTKLLKSCEAYMWKAAKKEGSKTVMGKNAGVEFVEAIFGQSKELEETEKLMSTLRLWDLRFDANCDDILRQRASASTESNSTYLTKWTTLKNFTDDGSRSNPNLEGKARRITTGNGNSQDGQQQAYDSTPLPSRVAVLRSESPAEKPADPELAVVFN